jgi:hypothetical protein
MASGGFNGAWRTGDSTEGRPTRSIRRRHKEADEHGKRVGNTAGQRQDPSDQRSCSGDLHRAGGHDHPHVCLMAASEKSRLAVSASMSPLGAC